MKMFGSVNGRQFLECLSDCEFLKKGSGQQSKLRYIVVTL